MADHTLTPAENARIDATVARVHRERADARTMGAKYDDACQRLAEQHDEIVKLRRRAEALEDQLADAQALAGRYWNNALAAIDRHGAEIGRLRLAWQSARRRARAYGEVITDLVEQRDTYAGWLKTAEEQLAVTTRPHRAEEQLAADTHPGTDRSTT